MPEFYFYVRTTGGYVFTGVCLFKFRVGGTPSQVLVGGVPHPRSWRGGCTASQVWLGGRGTQSQVWLEGYPIPGLAGGYPIPGYTLGPRMGYLPPTWDGIPPRPGMGYPPRPETGYPPPKPGMGYPPTDLGRGTPLSQHIKHLLYGRWYASCIRTGGLSCLNIPLETFLPKTGVLNGNCIITKSLPNL